jgi:hypothetical protein
MRIIKLSKKDKDMATPLRVDNYFENTLPNRTPPGKFLVTKGRIAENGLHYSEKLIFSYEGKIIYVAKILSSRNENVGFDSADYPFYFTIDLSTLSRAKGTLMGLEDKLGQKGLLSKNIVQSQGWPRLEDSPALDLIWEDLKIL